MMNGNKKVGAMMFRLWGDIDTKKKTKGKK